MKKISLVCFNKQKTLKKLSFVFKRKQKTEHNKTLIFTKIYHDRLERQNSSSDGCEQRAGRGNCKKTRRSWNEGGRVLKKRRKIKGFQFFYFNLIVGYIFSLRCVFVFQLLLELIFRQQKINKN